MRRPLQHFLVFCTALFLFSFPFWIPSYSFSFDTGILLTVISVIFTILVGFFIAAATSNYLRLQSLIAQEDSMLIGAYQMFCQIDPKHTKKIRDAIDAYATGALDVSLSEYVSYSFPQFERVLYVLGGLNPRTSNGTALLQNIANLRWQMISARQEIRLISQRLVKPGHWILLISLALLFSALLLHDLDGQLITSLFSGLLIVSIYLVLRILYLVDGNQLLEGKLSYENTQEIFRMIGTLPYFPEEALSVVAKPQGTYRLGILTANGRKIVIKR